MVKPLKFMPEPRLLQYPRNSKVKKASKTVTRLTFLADAVESKSVKLKLY
jgi:hypothetical protein